MDFMELLSEAKSLMYAGETEQALAAAKKAIAAEPQREEGYLVAGQITLSAGDPNSAAQFFSDLVRIAPKGDYFFLLGQAQAMNDDGMNALDSFEKALQTGCATENKGRIYKIMAMLDVEMSCFEDGLRNIENASQFISLDLELLKSRFLCYAGLENYKLAIAACNQMKIISPTGYEAYSMAFEILMRLELYSEAEKELERARRSVSTLPQLYFDDKVKFILESKTQNNIENLNESILQEVLHVYAEALDNLYGHGNDYDTAFGIILHGAQTYLQLKDGKNALRLVQMIRMIPTACRKQMPLLETRLKTDEESQQDFYANFLSHYAGISPEEMQKKYEAAKDALTPLTDISDGKKSGQSDDLPEEYNLTQEQKDIVWGLELSAYDLLEDYENEKAAAEFLQGSPFINSAYLGKYSVLRCRKCIIMQKRKNGEEPNAAEVEKLRKNYESAAGYWRNQRLSNPEDMLALPYEIRCLIDLERYDEAEALIAKLPVQVRPTLKSILDQEKGAGND